MSGDYVDAVQQEITGLYGNNIGVITPKAILQTRQQFQSGNHSFTLAIAFIALLVGAVGIITTLYTSVNERTKEIGTMKAIGAKGRFILTSVPKWGLLLIGIIGSLLGNIILEWVILHTQLQVLFQEDLALEGHLEQHSYQSHIYSK